jgi:hypothetical protein
MEVDYKDFEVGMDVECIEECSCNHAECMITSRYKPIGRIFTITHIDGYGSLGFEGSHRDYWNSYNKFKIVETVDDTELSDWI